MLLKKELNISTISNTELELELGSVVCYDYFKDNMKVEVRFEHLNEIELFVGETLTITNEIERDSLVEARQVFFTENYEIVECDNFLKNFSILADKYNELRLNSISLETEGNVLYLYFSFDEWHYFRSWDNHGIDISIHYRENEITFGGCEYVNDNNIRWRYDANKDNIDDFMCHVFQNDTYKLIGYAEEDSDEIDKYVIVSDIPESACFTDEVYIRKRVVFQEKPECVKWGLYEKDCNEGTISGLSVYRKNFKFQDVNHVYVYVTIPVSNISFPLTLTTGNDTYQEQNIYETFVRDKTSTAKNGIVEMEKIVYHPVSKQNDSYIPINKIKFNLHFREREKDGWIVKEDGLWNGMTNMGLCGDVTSLNDTKFFSYSDNAHDGHVDKGRQSDLLCYLGFNDADVKYQKSKLKKSFIRLSFYDSPNRANQNLLSFSTIYLDSSRIFSKMMSGANKKGTYVKSGSMSNTKYDNAKVDTEPCFTNHYNLDIEQIENFRLSSQVVVCDRSSKNSSEGFYLYLWADDDNGIVPIDVFMRVDFNHAGYGRVVPMTMPYLDGSNANRIYSMEEIAEIWNTNGGWGIRTNEKFSYIHFKCVYDSTTRKHVYYLDNDTYGTSTYEDGTPNELELNLYEPKITIA